MNTAKTGGDAAGVSAGVYRNLTLEVGFSLCLSNETLHLKENPCFRGWQCKWPLSPTSFTTKHCMVNGMVMDGPGFEADEPWEIRS